LISIGLVKVLPQAVHLDNAREFHSNALKRGCQEHGIEISFSATWATALWRTH